MAVLQHTSSDLLLWNVLVLLKKNLKLTRKSRLLFKLRVVHNIENRWKGGFLKKEPTLASSAPPGRRDFQVGEGGWVVKMKGMGIWDCARTLKTSTHETWWCNLLYCITLFLFRLNVASCQWYQAAVYLHKRPMFAWSGVCTHFALINIDNVKNFRVW